MNVIFTCGGTGGHINPGIAVANILRERYPDSNILFVGGEGGMEEDLVPKAGYKIEALPCSSLRRGLSPKSIIHNVKGVGYVVSALKKSKKLIESFQPDVILLHLVDGLVQIFVKQGHDGAHLVRRAFPVLGGEGVDRQIVETEVFAVGCDPAKCLAARGMARRARQTALLRPAAIAVHDDGNVPRQRLRRALFLKKCHKFVPFTAKAASGGFCGIV